MAVLFQYGSNCDEGQINGKDRLRGDAKFLSIAETVDDFRLAFDVWAAGRGCAASDIQPKPGSKVWGLLYEIPDYLITRETAHEKGRKAMDDIEDEGTVYRRESISVRQPDGQVITALTYRVISPQEGLETGLEYVGYIVKGLRDHGVSHEYIASVKQIAAVNNPKIADSLADL
jgi:gamma-glutamyl AIG2-like cyclotransferase